MGNFTNSQKLHAGNFKWIKEIFQFNKYFIKGYNDDSDERYFHETDVEYPENVHKLHNNLPFLPERMKIERVENLVSNLHDKNEYVIHIRSLK